MNAALLNVNRRRWVHLVWPREVSREQLMAALLSLHGLSTPSSRDALILRAVGTGDGVTHFLGVPEQRSDAARRQLQECLPGLAIETSDKLPELHCDRVWQAWLSSRHRPLNLTSPEPIARAILTALASVEADEALVLQWRLGPVRQPLAVGSVVKGGPGGPLGGLIRAPFVAPADLDSEARSALRDKQGLPGWKATLHIGVSAKGNRRQRQLLGRVSAALRTAQGPAAHVGFGERRSSAINPERRVLRWGVVINVGEMRGVSGWPLGETESLAVARVRSRALAASREVPSHGRVVARSTWPGAERDLALNPADALMHLNALGPTGSGKSTLLLNLICQDMAAGRAVVVIEPKGDLVRDVLERVPDNRLDDIVVIDPTDKAPVGLNALARPGRHRELVVDQVLAVFKGLFADSWGPRTQDILTAGLLTLIQTPGMSLVALPLLFTDQAFRRRLLSRVHDPLALGPFWDWFEGLSSGERAAALAPVMNKLRAFLLRPTVRRVIGQSRPRFDLRAVFTERKVVLVNLAKGGLGPEAAGLLGSLVMSQFWQTALGRHRVEPAKRHPVMVVVDEFQDYLHLPTDLGDVLAQARGLGIGITLAHQHLAQLSPNVRAAVLANARSRVVFQTNDDDARIIVRGDERLQPADVRGLGRYQVYASLVAGGEVTPFASGRTLAPPPKLWDAESVLARSRERFGMPVADIDAELEALAGSGQPHGRAGKPNKDKDPEPSTNRTGNGVFGVIERANPKLDDPREESS